VSNLFGKRKRESIDRALATLNSVDKARHAKRLPYTAQSYITLEPDKIPPLRYLSVFVRDRSPAALVDSGSNRTLIGQEGLRIIRVLSLPRVKGKPIRIKRADGRVATIKKTVQLPFQLGSKTHSLSVGLLPELAVPCLIGLDFLQKFDICVDFTASEWCFSNQPVLKYRFHTNESVATTENAYSRLAELTSDQHQRLDGFLRDTLPKASDNSGVTSLTEHRIDMGQNRPVK